ncbi:hypothetical protein ACFX11_032565 [Malus domestica]
MLLSWNTGFLDMAMAEVLSQSKDVASTCSSPKSDNTNLNHIACVVATAADTYSTSAVDSATLHCLTEAQENTLEPKLNA